MTSGSKYKRNQVDEAIAAVLARDQNGASTHVRTRIKRLLDSDRALGCDVQSDNPARRVFAFYGDEAPGRGTEIWFSGYEAFALLVGLRVLNHGPNNGRSRHEGSEAEARGRASLHSGAGPSGAL